MKLDKDLSELGFYALIKVGEEYRVLFSYDGNIDDVNAWNSKDNAEWVSERLTAALGVMMRQGLLSESTTFGHGFMPFGNLFAFSISFVNEGSDKRASWSLDEILEEDDKVKWAKIPEEYINYARTRLEEF